jgi:hypothetical protein
MPGKLLRAKDHIQIATVGSGLARELDCGALAAEAAVEKLHCGKFAIDMYYYGDAD